MRCASVYSSNIDGYEAGLEIAEALAEIKPQVLLLFTSIHYDPSELLGGIGDIFEDQLPVIVGGTGDGVYETSGVFIHGAAALGLNFGDAVETSLALTAGAAENPYEAARQCAAQNVQDLGGPPDLAFCFTDLTCDGTKVTEGLVAGGLKVFQGGLTGDDWQFKKGVIYCGRQAYQQRVLSLALKGCRAFRINTASGWKPLGSPGVVEEAEGNVIRRISGMSTFDFIYQQFGMPPAEAELGVVPLAAYVEDNSNFFLLRSPRDMNVDSGQITYFGGIDTKTNVRVCSAGKDDILYGVNEALDGMGHIGFTPRCAVIVSCGARKMLLGEQISREVELLFESLGRRIPLAGYVSVGEIGPFWNGTHHTIPYFHNVSYVVNIIGEKQ
ncbi:MAG TPA: FIST N-terminal domain-containing protein [Desulfosalsimonadaceae bacterium]|nr:FIST N-terminal domain-containing protein [Desulfosalsimonadaceae bacterium]